MIIYFIVFLSLPLAFFTVDLHKSDCLLSWAELILGCLEIPTSKEINPLFLNLEGNSSDRG